MSFIRKTGPAAGHVACRMRLLSQRSERGRAHRRVGRRNRLQMIVCGQLPGDVVVGLAAVLGITLRREQVYGVVSVGLVETHDVSASGIVAIFQFQFLLCRPTSMC